MALSLEALHKPINKFFSELLATGPDSPVSFFFDKHGSAISDGDFTQPDTDPPVYNPNLALERWSELVNRVPAEDADGVSVFLTLNGIDSTYGLRMLKPAQPCLAGAADEQARDQIVGNFSELKQHAVKSWDQISQESSTGLMLQYLPSPPSPTDWYNRDAEIWTAHSFQIQGESVPAAPSAPGTRLWRLKIDDATLESALGDQAPAPPPARKLLGGLVAARRHSAAAFRVEGVAGGNVGHATNVAAGGRRTAERPFLAAAAFTRRGAALEPARPAASAADAATSNRYVLHDQFRKNIGALSIRERLQVSDLLVPKAPTQPATTPGVSISFEYCVIRVTRPWLNDAFLYDRSWCIPGTAKGELTAPGTWGAMPLLPIAAVAVRNLRISGNWTQEDIDAASRATNFGPFRVTGGIVNGALSREGIQVIGWLVQRMPTLPPNDPDSP